MKRTPPIEELDDSQRYEKVITLSYSEVAPFVFSRLFSPSPPMIIIWGVTLLSLFLTIWFWPGVVTPSSGYGTLAGLVTGLVVIPLLLIPIHEGLHIIPYALAGARDIRVGADLSQGIIYVTAHRFVAGHRLFTTVAAAPFLVVTIALGMLIIFTGGWWSWVCSLALMAHTTMCAGDAAMLSAIAGYNGRRVYTWDDADLKEAYFYASREEMPT